MSSDGGSAADTTVSAVPSGAADAERTNALEEELSNWHFSGAEGMVQGRVEEPCDLRASARWALPPHADKGGRDASRAQSGSYGLEVRGGRRCHERSGAASPRRSESRDANV